MSQDRTLCYGIPGTWHILILVYDLLPKNQQGTMIYEVQGSPSGCV